MLRAPEEGWLGEFHLAAAPGSFAANGYACAAREGPRAPLGPDGAHDAHGPMGKLIQIKFFKPNN